VVDEVELLTENGPKHKEINNKRVKAKGKSPWARGERLEAKG